MAARKRTQGVSPKASAASAAALVAPLAARLLADAFGVNIDSETVEGLILAGIAGVSALVAAYAAPPGTVVADRKKPLAREAGQGVIGALVLILVAVLVYWLLAALTGSFVVAVVGAIIVLIAGIGPFSRW